MILPASITAAALSAVAVIPADNPTETVTAIVVILGFFLNWLDRRRNAAWEREDKLHKQEVEAKAAEAALESAKAARLVEESKLERSKQLKSIETKIDENTALSRDAFDAANGVNNKIASLGAEIRDQNASTQKLQ